MTRETLTVSRANWLRGALEIMLSISFVCACSFYPPGLQAQRAAASLPAKIKLNGDEIGTTNDTVKLDKGLADIFKEREKYKAYRPGTDEVERTVGILAEPSLKVGEVLKVAAAIKKAGASPVVIPIEVDRQRIKAAEIKASPFMVVDGGEIKPNPLTLIVMVGNIRFPFVEDTTKLINGDIELFLTPFILKHSEKNSIPKEFVVVEIPKDGEYFVDGKSVRGSALRDEIQARFKEPRTDKRVVVFVDSDSEFTYGRLADVAYAAFEAGASMLQTLTLVS